MVQPRESGVRGSHRYESAAAATDRRRAAGGRAWTLCGGLAALVALGTLLPTIVSAADGWERCRRMPQAGRCVASHQRAVAEAKATRVPNPYALTWKRDRLRWERDAIRAERRPAR